jgi:hypothetical protein
MDALFCWEKLTVRNYNLRVLVEQPIPEWEMGVPFYALLFVNFCVAKQCTRWEYQLPALYQL